VSVIAVIASIPNKEYSFDRVRDCYVRLINTSTQWQYAKYQLGDKKKYSNKKQAIIAFVLS
jgi:stress response protein SCP2